MQAKLAAVTAEAKATDQSQQVKDLERKLTQIGLETQQKFAQMEEEYEKKLSQS